VDWKDKTTSDVRFTMFQKTVTVLLNGSCSFLAWKAKAKDLASRLLDFWIQQYIDVPTKGIVVIMPVIWQRIIPAYRRSFVKSRRRLRYVHSVLCPIAKYGGNEAAGCTG